MEMFILMMFILMAATMVAFSAEIYLFLSLMFGSIISDIKKKIDSIIGRK